MIVEFQKLHSNYLQSKEFGLGSEGRINKLCPIGFSEANSTNMKDMCIVNNNSFKKTILTNPSNGLLSFKGDYKRLAEIDSNKVFEALKKLMAPNRDVNITEKEITALKDYSARLCKEHPVMAKFFGNKTFQKAMTLMNQNQLLADAGIALLYTCCFRPLSIAALPTKDSNEKEKNTYQIGHSISTGIIGFISAFVLQTPIKHALDKVMTAVDNKNAQKYISKEATILFRKESKEQIREIMMRSHQPITLPLKAALTIFLVPRILKLFGLTKKPKFKVDNNQTQNQPQVQNQQVKNQNMKPYDAFKYYETFKSKNSSFQKFSGGLSYENK